MRIWDGMTRTKTKTKPLQERAWNPFPDLMGRGLYDALKGRYVSIQDRKWRENIQAHFLSQNQTSHEARILRRDLEENILTTTSILEALYKTTSLGNVYDPLTETIIVILSRNSSFSQARKIIKELMAIPSGIWGILDMSQEDLERMIPSKSSKSVINAIHFLEKTYGRDDVYMILSILKDEQLLEALKQIPTLSHSEALSIMMYSFGREVFPINNHIIRFLKRTQLLEPLIGSLMKLEHKEIQQKAEKAIPPSMRGLLNINAIHHGQKICLPRKPLCGECALKLLCATGRQKIHEKIHSQKRLKLVDMFCGAGGLSEGFRQAGYKTVLAVDADTHAMRTYRLNHPEVPDEAMLCRDIRDFRNEAELIRKIIGDEQIDVLVGGPPCQGFSRAGLRAKSAYGVPIASQDERNHLYRELVALLEVLQPKAMVMENVPGIGEVVYEDNTTFIDAATEALEAAGYATNTWLLNSASYGVPQERIRRIIVGIRGGPPLQSPPTPCHHAPTRQYPVDALDPCKPPPRSLIDGIGDLPSLQVNSGRNISAYQGQLLTGHVARYNNDNDLERFREILPGESYRSLIQRRPDLAIYSTRSFADKYFKMPAEKPARTIVAHLQKDGNGYIHPLQTRSITPREAARLQSFRDDYLFTGPISTIFRQIGNAVPPLMAAAIAKHIAQHLKDH